MRKALPAMETRVGPLSGVDPLMRHKMRVIGKAFPTIGADIRRVLVGRPRMHKERRGVSEVTSVRRKRLDLEFFGFDRLGAEIEGISTLVVLSSLCAIQHAIHIWEMVFFPGQRLLLTGR